MSFNYELQRQRLRVVLEENSTSPVPVHSTKYRHTWYLLPNGVHISIESEERALHCMKFYVNPGIHGQVPRPPVSAEWRSNGARHTSGGGRKIQREGHWFFKVRSHDEMTQVLEFLRFLLRNSGTCTSAA
jgi:hypothetical protein